MVNLAKKISRKYFIMINIKRAFEDLRENKR